MTQVTAQLDEELAIDLECLMVASMSSKAGLMRLALRAFIDDTIAKNKGIGEKFHEAKKLRKLPKHKHLTIIK